MGDVISRMVIEGAMPAKVAEHAIARPDRPLEGPPPLGGGSPKVGEGACGLPLRQRQRQSTLPAL